MFALGVAVISLVVSYAHAQDANCDYVKYVSKERTRIIFSPNFPLKYKAEVSCRWIVVCEEGYNCEVDCKLNLPQSSSCSMDRLFISKTGDSKLTSAEYYCGRGSVSAVSTGKQISLALVASRNSSGGRFRCTLSAQAASTPACNCGYKKKNRIVGGEETRPNEYPMMAGVVYVGENNIKCGAVIIDNSYVLTAAHCVANKTLNQIAVVVGEHDVTRGADSPDLQAFKVVAIKSHYQYNPDTLDNDIAILQLNGMIEYSDNVGPACLPFKFANRDFAGASVTILGWGTTTPGGPTSRVLRKVDVQVISQASCSRNISTVTSRQMCTFTQGKDACQNDSGGPLLYQDASNGRLYNVGVVSFGRFCASNYPGVNTRITSFLDWIVTNAPANYCRMFALGMAVISLVVRYAHAQNANCDYVIYVSTGKTYTISSPNYSNNYNQGVSCRWIVVCEEGYNCKVDCELNLPQSSSCSMDRLFISKTGDSKLTSAEYYCGRGSVSAVSTGKQISLALVASRNSSGGRFRCTLSAQAASTPACNCGYKKKNRIVGGEETRPNEYPMMAGVVYVGENNIKCGAVIIDNSYVLTAAHCVANKTLNQIAVVVGEHDVSKSADSPDLQAFKVVAIKSHYQYNPDTLDNDIAILQLNGMIVYSDNVGPACLPFKFANRDFAGASVTILGWGTTTPGGPTSRVLRKVDVQVISHASCSRSISTVTSRQMCTFTQGKDACQDDSGGPLLYQDASNGRLYNVGVVSFGRFCASNYPGVNTRITSFLDWIVTNAPANYCRI